MSRTEFDVDCMVFKNSKYRKPMQKVPCFWCGYKLYRIEATADHILPYSLSGQSRPENLEICCHGCQIKRSRLSQIAGRMRSYKAGRAPTLNLTRLAERTYGLLPQFLELERLYHAKLVGKRLSGCLREIDYVLEFIIEQELKTGVCA